MGGISHLKIRVQSTEFRVQSTEFRVQSSDLFRSFLPWWYHDGLVCSSGEIWWRSESLEWICLAYIALKNKGLFLQKCWAWIQWLKFVNLCCIKGYILQIFCYVMLPLHKSIFLCFAIPHTSGTTFIFTEKSNISKWFFDNCNAEIAKCCIKLGINFIK